MAQDTPSVSTVMDTTSLVPLELNATAEKEMNATPLALMLAKLDLPLLNLTAKTESTNSKENKDISAMLMPLDFTNASEMLTAQATLLLDLNSFHALKELNADVETPSKNAQVLEPSLLALILLTTNHTPPERPLEPPEPLEHQLFLLTNLLTKLLFAEITDGIASTSLKDILPLPALTTPAEMLEMVVNATGISILVLVHVLETAFAPTLELATLPLTAEIPTISSARSTHVAELVEFAFQFALNKPSPLVTFNLYPQ